MTDDKKRIFQIIGVVIVILFVGFLISKQTPNQSQPPQSNQENTDQTLQAGQHIPPPLPRTPVPNGPSWEGTLKISDNLQKGNLLLVTPQHTIYLFTSRDFSSLLDTQVKVIYQGDGNNFTLLDIVAK